MTVGNR